MRIATKIQYKDFYANIVMAEFSLGPDVPNVTFRNADTGRILMNPVMGISTWSTFMAGLSLDEDSDMIILAESDI